MSKILSLNKEYQFNRAYKKGMRCVSHGVIFCAYRNCLKINRLGIIANKKFGGAVKRNRVRRIIKTAYSSLCTKILVGFDIIIIARIQAINYKLFDIQRDMFFSAKKLRIINIKNDHKK